MRYDFSKTFDIERAKTYLNRLIEKRVKVDISQKRDKRTLSQNSLFHAWVRVLQEHIGEVSFEDCKRDIKRTILGVREVINRFTGEVGTEDYKTSEMDTKQLSDFMEKFKSWADVEFGCYLPTPDDSGYDDLVDKYGMLH